MNDSDKKTLVQFGAGNIGRSFIGQIFSRNRWDVLFVDINDSLIEALNKRGSYNIHVKSPSGVVEIIIVEQIRALNGKDKQAVIGEIINADLLCTSVGQSVLPHITPVIAKAIEKRTEPLDIILAENIRNGGDYVRGLLGKSLPNSFPLSERVGIVETSIGKMVPIMKEEDLLKDPLAVFAEPYNNLIVDKKGFLGSIPQFRDIEAVDNIAAYVDRKLFIHNLGHASAAYLGFGYNEKFTYIWEALEEPSVYKDVLSAMKEAASAMLCEYPRVFSEETLDSHIEDLLDRFQNRALGDTIFRVGRDLNRKLDPEDRIIGAIKLAKKHGVSYENILSVLRAACSFKACNEKGQLFEKDKKFHKKYNLLSADIIMRDLMK